MSRRANYSIFLDTPGKPLVIKDEGPWDKFLSITNDAENVVQELVQSGKLENGRRLLYLDSEGALGELCIRDGVFVGFAPVAETDL